MARKPANKSGKDPTQRSSLVSLEFTEPFERALRLIEDSTRHVFVTGRTGTGKLKYLSAYT